ncbi:putative bifunctional diguanylate cyclase/phosphodiesterase [Rhabdochromatium marinum]|uniref:putative bifunctional diguanylate cyclase/phosphodiesterase n=1 Tax=Rhabdochromatium marinum TaxID=48729 RepID=UPI001908B05D|nr:GGDEF and EAL domain-containing protein [Rhabdochromatium marinum]MBK1650241.1 hypothetical protein [Rhabdochromatium marinum]
MIRLPPLPSFAYLLLFIALAVAASGAVGWWMLERMDAVKQEAMESNRDAAHGEVKRALSVTLSTLKHQLNSLAVWGETRQQLTDPTYYGYWRENRALANGRLAAFVVDLELYNAAGQALLEHPGRMPGRLPEHTIYLHRETDEAYLYLFTPVRLDTGQVIGHAGLKAPLITVLLDVNRFIYADPERLDILDPGGTLDAGEWLALSGAEALSGRIAVTPQPLPETEALERLMGETLMQLAVVALLLGALYYLLVVRLLQRPLTLLARHIDALRRGETSGPLADPPRWALRLRELETVRSSLNDYQEALQAAQMGIRQKTRELWELSHRDPLTGLNNRLAYDEDWKQLLAMLRGRPVGVSVILIDVDHFRAINDTYGSDVGDELIRSIARCLANSLGEDDRLYRLGGDEFAIRLVGMGSKDAESRAQDCQLSIGDYDFKETLGIREPVHFSVGLAYAEGTHSKELAQLHRQADIALYQAKRPGTAKIVRYTPEMGAAAEAMISSRYVHAVYRAIEQGEGFQLYYQPVVALDKTGGYHEVLVRLRDEEGLISPAFLFPVVEAEKLAIEFDQAVLHHLIELLRRDALPAGAGLSFNLDGTSLTDPRIHEQLVELEPFLAQRKLLLEVTETALIADLNAASTILKDLRDRGYLIALDDFGSGYSSLRYLSAMPVDVVKFDMSMVRDLELNDGQGRMTEAIVQMILNAGYKLVAEGVETESLMNRVRAAGFTHVQGYLIGRPSPSLSPIR